MGRFRAAAAGLATGLIAALGLATTVQANGPQITEIRNVYAVEGNSANILMNAMEAKGPGEFWALTSWHINWRYNYNNGGGNCRMTSLEVELDLEITMPYWPGYYQSSACMQRNWDRMLDRLASHEENHAQLARRFAAEMYRALGDFSQASCNGFEQGANQLGHDYLNRLDQINQAYDKETSHGLFEGVELKSC